MSTTSTVSVRLTKEEADYIRHDEESVSEVLKQALQLYYEEKEARKEKISGKHGYLGSVLLRRD